MGFVDHNCLSFKDSFLNFNHASFDFDKDYQFSVGGGEICSTIVQLVAQILKTGIILTFLNLRIPRCSLLLTLQGVWYSCTSHSKGGLAYPPPPKESHYSFALGA